MQILMCGSGMEVSIVMEKLIADVKTEVMKSLELKQEEIIGFLLDLGKGRGVIR
jgi:hypothetical protein